MKKFVFGGSRASFAAMMIFGVLSGAASAETTSTTAPSEAAMTSESAIGEAIGDAPSADAKVQNQDGGAPLLRLAQADAVSEAADDEADDPRPDELAEDVDPESDASAEGDNGDAPDEDTPGDDSNEVDDALQEGTGPDVADDGTEAAEGDEVDVADEARRDWGRLQPAADLVEAGGPIIVILAILSIISLAIILVKLLQFFGARTGDHRFIEKAAGMLERGRAADALDFVERRRGVVARVMETALRGKALGAPDAQVREEVQRIAQIKLDGLERGLPLLSLIATISPLLGLLGTVLGMIEAFQQLENAGDRVDPAILSGGIWEALLTTAAGLSVAIPAAAFFTWLQRTVDVAGQHMENAATRVFTADLYVGGRASSSDESDD
ncbi:MAG: MotA/TolQ/ExbB proton channel family protein [Pseudomonadota bacterium]